MGSTKDGAPAFPCFTKSGCALGRGALGHVCCPSICGVYIYNEQMQCSYWPGSATMGPSLLQVDEVMIQQVWRTPRGPSSLTNEQKQRIKQHVLQKMDEAIALHEHNVTVGQRIYQVVEQQVRQIEPAFHIVIMFI